ncbi:MAG TPA: hypothetical protein VGF75_07560 [Candidatus Saccharimonadales bacterium]|jgi:hypothetical protein
MESKKHPKQKKVIKIIPKHRKELDLEKLAEALLNIVDTLSPEDREKFAKEGNKVLKEMEQKKRAA